MSLIYSRGSLAALVRLVVFDTVSSEQEESGFEAAGQLACLSVFLLFPAATTVSSHSPKTCT